MSDIDKLQRTTGGGEKPAVNQRILIKIDNRETSVLKDGDARYSLTFVVALNGKLLS